MSGFYEAGVANCSACSQTCLTCTNGSACSECDPAKFRNLTGGLCNCLDGYYDFYHTNQTKTCEKCNP